MGLRGVCGCSGRGGLRGGQDNPCCPPCLLGQLSGGFPTGERGAGKVKEHRAPHLLLIQEGHACPPPSPAHPWCGALGGPHRPPQPGGGWLFNTPLGVLNIYLTPRYSLSSPQDRLLVQDRQRGGGVPPCATPFPCDAARLLCRVGFAGAGGGSPKGISQPPGAVAGNQSRSFPPPPPAPNLPVRPERPVCWQRRRWERRKPIFRNLRRAFARRGSGAGGPERVKSRRRFPVMHLARC